MAEMYYCGQCVGRTRQVHVTSSSTSQSLVVTANMLHSACSRNGDETHPPLAFVTAEMWRSQAFILVRPRTESNCAFLLHNSHPYRCGQGLP